MAKKLKADDVVDLKGLSDQLAQAISQGFKKGTKSAFTGVSFIDELNDQLKDFTKQQQARAVSEQIVQKAIKETISEREAELRVMSQLALQENANAIKTLQGRLKNKNLAIQERNELQKQLASLRDVPGAIESRTQTVAKLIKAEQEQEKINELQEEYKKKIEEIAEEAKELTGSMGKFLDTVRSIATDGTVGAAIFFAKMNKAREAIVEGYHEIREEGFTISQALGKTTQNVGVYFSTWGVGFKEAMEAQKGLVESLGNTSEVTAQAIGNAAQLGKTFGISEEAAGKLTGQLMSMPGATAETANNTLEFAGNLAKAAHVAPGAVMASIAGSAEEVALYSKDGGKNIAVAAVAAKKLGIEFSTITKATGALLDFENSINKQMEASVLLGREINLDKARELSLNGDLVGATQELLQNIGGEAEFNKMNVMQRKALADSMGVTVQELGSMVKNQDKLADLTQEQRDALAQGEVSLDEMFSKASGLASKIGDTGVAAFGLVKGFTEVKHVTKEVLGSIGGIFKGLSGGTGAMGKFKEGFKGALGIEGAADKTKDATEVTQNADKVKTGGGFKKAMGDLAEGFKAMGQSGVGKGVFNTAVAGPALVLALPSIPFLLFMGLTPLKQLGDNFLNLAMGLEFMGSGKTAAGALVLALAGPALAAAILSIPFLAFISIPAIGKGIELGLTGLGKGLTALGNPATAVFALIGIGLIGLLGAAMIPFAYALSLVTPLIDSFGKIIVGVLSAIPPIITAVADGFVKMFGAINMDNIGPILLLGPALFGIAAGLGAMALTGLAALPVIGALVGLALVAPALTALADSLGGIGGGGEKGGDEKMDTLITKIDELISISKQGGVVMLDGNKVGQALGYSIRRNINTSGVS